MDHQGLSRRQLIQGLVTSVSAAAVTGSARAQTATPRAAADVPYTADVLPAGIRSRFVDNINGIRMHVLEAGFESADRPAVLLIHGFPELAYSWRKVMLPLAAAGYHVIAPDLQRLRAHLGHRRAATTTTSRRSARSTRCETWSALVSAFGYRSVAAVIGHDFGSPRRRLVCGGAARHVPIGGDDERAVRRSAGAAVQHRRRAAGRRGQCGRRSRSTTSSRR